MKKLLMLIYCSLISLNALSADPNDLCRLFNICPNGIVIDGVSIMNQQECQSAFEVSPYTSSPFVKGVCSKYQVIKQKTTTRNRAFFVKNESTIAGVDGDYYGVADLTSAKPKIEMFIDYGVANALEVTELARIYKQYGLTSISPYNGVPLQKLSLDMLADFTQISTDTRHSSFQFDTSQGYEFFSGITVSPFPNQGFAFVSIELTVLGASIISQSLAFQSPLYGVFAWRANHRFGDLIIPAYGDLGCVVAESVGDLIKLKSCNYN
jgi:hypothetical protein